jgi:HEPN domain-containing protein
MKKLTAAWVRKAEVDLRTAEKLAGEPPTPNDVICFLCQQAAEKYFKALLQERGEPIPRIHDLKELLELLLPHDPTLQTLRRGLKSLSRYAVDYRYPGKHATAPQMRAALKLAKRIRAEVRKRLGLREPRPRKK